MVATREINIPVVLPGGAECEQCIERLRVALLAVDGVQSVHVDAARSVLSIAFDPDSLSTERLEQAAASIGVSLEERFRHENLPLEGMDCPDCARTLELAVARLPGVLGVSVNFFASTMHVEYEEARLDREAVVQAVRATGYEVPGKAPLGTPWWQRRSRQLTVVGSGLLLAAGSVLALLGLHVAAIILFALSILAGGRTIARGAAAALRVGMLDMNALMTLAVVGAAAIGDWGEAALIVFLFSVGNVLEDQAMDRTRTSIRQLIKTAPTHATRLREGREETLVVAELHPGDLIAVKPGQALPVDGVVAGGSSTVNQAAITGEATPVTKGPGDQVYAGTLNELGYLEVRVTKRAGESNIARIIEMVESAQARKAQTQRFMDLFARYYTPAVIAVAVALAVLPPVLLDEPVATWLYRALAVLLLGCPCSLVISTPVTIVTGLSSAARHGVLIKGGTYLEQLGLIRTVALDKTGTLTYGRPEVTDLVALAGYDPTHVLAIAAGLESRATHPLASAIMRRARQEDVRPAVVSDFQTEPGKGARASLGGTLMLIGSESYLAELGVQTTTAAEMVVRFHGQGKTVVLVAAGPQVIGVLAVADTVREGVRDTLRCLRPLGVRRLVMLTGDSTAVAAALAGRLGVDDFRAELLPEDKVREVEGLRAEGPVAMVGDGINDAPALAAATVGIAMGAAGSDTALETADVALMADDLTRLPYLLRLGRATLAVIRQNIIFSLVVKLGLLALAVPGLLALWMAVLGDVGVSLLVIGNGLRLLAVRPVRGPEGEPCLGLRR